MAISVCLDMRLAALYNKICLPGDCRSEQFWICLVSRYVKATASMATSVYRKHESRNSSYYLCVEDHFETFEQVCEDRFERRYGFYRPYVKRVITPCPISSCFMWAIVPPAATISWRTGGIGSVSMDVFLVIFLRAPV